MASHDSTDDLAARIRKRLLPGPGRILVALSGGRDSTVLLHALATDSRLRARLIAVHVDHGMQALSADWADHCRALASDLDVSYRGLETMVDDALGEGSEAAARRARYAALASVMKAGDLLLTAHHANDQLETLLLRMLRGSGTRGLAGIREQRPFAAGWLQRPLLPEPAVALEEYARAHGLSWIEDPSNRDPSLDRNYLRRQVLPHLIERWPQAPRQADRLARHLAEDADLLAELAHMDLGSEEPESRLAIARIQDLAPERQSNALRQWLEACTLSVPSRDVVERIRREVLAAAPDARPEVRWAGHSIWRHGGCIRLSRPHAPELPPTPGRWENPVRPLELPRNGRYLLQADASGEVSERLLSAPLEVCYRQGGERFHDGRHHRQLKEWLRVQGFPPGERDRIPLLFAGDDLVAVGETLLDPAWQTAPSEPGYRLVWEWPEQNAD